MDTNANIQELEAAAVRAAHREACFDALRTEGLVPMDPIGRMDEILDWIDAHMEGRSAADLVEAWRAEHTPTNRIVSVVSKVRDVNAKMRGSDTYCLVGLPGSDRLVWVDQVVGAEVVRDNYPRTRGIRVSERRGSANIRVTLPIGSVILYLTKYTDGSPTSRNAVLVTADGGEMTKDGGAIKASTLPSAGTVRQRKTTDGWSTMVDGKEWK